ncbi:hypothetical protein T4E_5634 [Trichinella pseudospiralis]|uniref:Uncharacterized protein n=1 Tax=Trichinella pseudospiralis TaxID=6337 RepID=A0A0V0XFM6_TRIPS|nr:hypothetical protein T4E_5634 [Trichinella pseudospiralis]
MREGLLKGNNSTQYPISAKWMMLAAEGTGQRIKHVQLLRRNCPGTDKMRTLLLVGCFQPQKGIEIMQKSIVLYEDITLLEILQHNCLEKTDPGFNSGLQRFW